MSFRAAALIKNSVDTKSVELFTAICPGPNLAYFSKISSLEEMAGHIYGRLSLLNNTYRQNMFIKELKMYVEYFKKEVKKITPSPSERQIAYVNEFRENMLNGIEYYRSLFPKMLEETKEYRENALQELQNFKEKLNVFAEKYQTIFPTPTHNLVPA